MRNVTALPTQIHTMYAQLLSRIDQLDVPERRMLILTSILLD
jgi:hypothetical protein